MKITGELKLDYSGTTNRKIDWTEAVGCLDFAFQPIVNPYTGMTYAVEALLRNTQSAGFDSIAEFFDTAYYESVLFTIDVELRKKAVEKFKKIKFYKKIKIFYKYDPRVHIMDNYQFGATENILKKMDLKKAIGYLSPQFECFATPQYHPLFLGIAIIYNFFIKFRYFF